MPFDAPFALGPFTVDAQGRIAPTDPAIPAGFSVAWRGVAVQARMLPGERLTMEATVGRVPSTAAAVGRLGAAERRDAVFTLVRALRDILPPGWTVRLSPEHRVLLVARSERALPATVTELVTELTLFLLRLEPYRRALGESGMEAPGTAKTCPG